MTTINLSSQPLSVRLFASVLLCAIGLTYITLLMHVYIDTEMKPSMVADAYKSMEYIELTTGAHEYLPYYIFFIFAPAAAIFMFTSYTEGWKRFFAVAPFLVIAGDIASMYLIHYVSPVFGYVLWAAGTCLAFMFLTLYLMTMYDIWLRRTTEQRETKGAK